MEVGFILSRRLKPTLSSILDSLIKWFAYWAIGHSMSMMYHCRIIEDTIDIMFSLLPLILPPNRTYVREYLSEIWQPIMTLVLSFGGRREYAKVLHDKFEQYISAEEMRIRENLDQLKYRIDSMQTLYIVMGPGNLEKVM